MRIGVIDNLADGGAKRIVCEHVLRLSTMHEVYYAGPKGDHYFDPGLKAHKRYVMMVPGFTSKGLYRPVKELLDHTNLFFAYLRAYLWFKKHNVQVVVCHPDQQIQAPYILGISSIPTIYFCEEWKRIVYEPELHPLPQNQRFKYYYELLRRQLIRRIDRCLAGKSDVIVVGSAFVAEQVRMAYNRQARVISLGVDTSQFKPIKMDTKKYFLFVGTQTHTDGYDLITQLKQAFDTIKVIEVNIHTKRLLDDELIALYQSAVAVLCLARKEPFGLTALEAMACGTPVIAVKEGGYAETILDGQTGFLINRDIKDLKKTVHLLASDTALRARFGKQARSHVVDNYSMDDHIKRFEQIVAQYD
jgi:glycosyltransferase involved in cell wall biosynthesis